jgi:hypothetical protein
VNHSCFGVFGAPQHHRATGSRAAHPRLDNAECKRCSDRRIDGIATCVKYGSTHLSGTAMLCSDDASFGGDHNFAGGLRV